MRLILVILLSMFLLVQLCSGSDLSDPVIKSQEQLDPKRPLNRELQTSVADGFTFAAVGDCIISRPLSQYAQSDSDFAKAIKVIQDSDAAYGNLETSILDMPAFQGYPYSWVADWTLVSDPA